MNLRKQLFFKYAQDGLTHTITDMLKKYTPKKGRRFSVDDITYEISMPALEDDRVMFEISSKIPEEKFTDKTTLKVYFNAIKKIMGKDKNKFSSIEMENIIHDTNKMVEKSRDYVKISYKFSFSDLYEDKKIAKQVTVLKQDKAALKKIPEVFGVSTLGGRLVLLAIKDTLYENCTAAVDSLIESNKKVKKELKIK